MNVYTYTENELTENLNLGKDILAGDLYNAGVIDKDQCRIMQEDYAIMLAPSSIFGKTIRKALGWEKDKTYFKTIKLKLNNRDDNNDNKSEDSSRERVDTGS